MAEVQRSLPADYLGFLNDPSVIAQWREGCQYDFAVTAVEWTENERCLLSFTLFGRKALYLVCMKVSQAHFLDGVLLTRWSELSGADSPKGCSKARHLEDEKEPDAGQGAVDVVSVFLGLVAARHQWSMLIALWWGSCESS
ncbi:hypothetical protein SRHO_G00287660 [Serrasalmus rhombeus]